MAVGFTIYDVETGIILSNGVTSTKENAEKQRVEGKGILFQSFTSDMYHIVDGEPTLLPEIG